MERLDCWVSFVNQKEPILTEDGTTLKLETTKCTKTLDCMEKFHESFFKPETTRMTKQGLITDASPEGNIKMSQWLKNNCRHPQKSQIIKHVSSTPPMGVIIPKPLINQIKLKIPKCKYCTKQAARYHARHDNGQLEHLCEKHYGKWHPQ